VTEKQDRRSPTHATESTPRPGDFPIGSRQSRAAARALLEERRRPKGPPAFKVDLSFLSIEECREIYARLEKDREQHPHGDSEIYFELILPAGFTPRVEAAPVMPVDTDD
jgi:hypothetical protein